MLPATEVAAGAVVLGALAQSVSGIGLGLVSGPLLVAALGPAAGVRCIVVLSLLLNVVLLAREVRRVAALPAVLLLLPAVLITPGAAWLARQAAPRVLALTAGLLTLAGTAALASGRRWHAARGPAGALAAGAASGTMNVFAGISGPAAALYAVNAGWPPARLRPTLQAYFLVLNLVTLAVLGGPDLTGGSVVLLLCGLAVGLLAGAPLSRRLKDQTARRGTLLLAAGSGLVAIVHALSMP